MSEYIERGALIEWLDKVDGIIADGTVETPTLYKQVITDIKQFPAADVVPKTAYDQVVWERDLAIEQLREDYGVSLGEKKSADVVEVKHGRWEWDENAMDWGLGGWVCNQCKEKNDNIPAKPDVNPYGWVGSFYCPNCGAKMDGGADK